MPWGVWRRALVVVVCYGWGDETLFSCLPFTVIPLSLGGLRGLLYPAGSSYVGWWVGGCCFVLVSATVL